MSKNIKNPETIALHGGDYRSDPATTAVAVPDAEWEGIIISSPCFVSIASKLRINASVPLLTPTAYFEPQNFENSLSNDFTLFPKISRSLYCKQSFRAITIENKNKNTNLVYFKL